MRGSKLSDFFDPGDLNSEINTKRIDNSVQKSKKGKWSTSSHWLENDVIVAE